MAPLRVFSFGDQLVRYGTPPRTSPQPNQARPRPRRQVSDHPGCVRSQVQRGLEADGPPCGAVQGWCQ